MLAQLSSVHSAIREGRGAAQEAKMLNKLYQNSFTSHMIQAKAVAKCITLVRSILEQRKKAETSSSSSNSASSSSSIKNQNQSKKRHRVDSTTDRGSRGQTEKKARLEKDIWSAQDILPKGHEVAAMVNEHNVPPLWIQATILQVVQSRGDVRYVVRDDDQGDDEKFKRKQYTLTRRYLLPLPSLDDVPLSQRTVFSKGTRVLAVYPGCTALYPATVHKTPSPGTNNYIVLFEDDEEGPKPVAARGVCPLKPLSQL